MFDKIIELLKRKNIFDYKESLGELSFVIKTCDYRITCYKGVHESINGELSTPIYTVFAGGQKTMEYKFEELDLLIQKLEIQIDMIIDDPLFTYFAETQGEIK